jgi:hypothetical protein
MNATRSSTVASMTNVEYDDSYGFTVDMLSDSFKTSDRDIVSVKTVKTSLPDGNIGGESVGRETNAGVAAKPKPCSAILVLCPV